MDVSARFHTTLNLPWPHLMDYRLKLKNSNPAVSRTYSTSPYIGKCSSYLLALIVLMIGTVLVIVVHARAEKTR